MSRVAGGAILGASVGVAIATLIALAQLKLALSGPLPHDEPEWPALISALLIGVGGVAGALYGRRATSRVRDRDIADSSSGLRP